MGRAMKRGFGSAGSVLFFDLRDGYMVFTGF